nr:translation initiation factor IF-2-like [Taeniopygia guttata]
MFGRVVLTQAGTSPKQPGFSRDIWDGNCGTPSLAPPLFPALGGGQQGPAHHRGGFALLAVCPPTLFSCSGITDSPSPNSFWSCASCFGGSDPTPDPWGCWSCTFPASQPWRRAGCSLSWPWRRWPRVGFLSLLTPEAGGAAPSQRPSPGEGGQGLEVGCPSPKGGGQGLEVGCPSPGGGGQGLEVGCPIPKGGGQGLEVGCPIPKCGCPIPRGGGQGLDVGCPIPKGGGQGLEVGCPSPKDGCPIPRGVGQGLDVGCPIPKGGGQGLEVGCPIPRGGGQGLEVVPVALAGVGVTQPGPLFPLKQFPRG